MTIGFGSQPDPPDLPDVENADGSVVVIDPSRLTFEQGVTDDGDGTVTVPAPATGPDDGPVPTALVALDDYTIPAGTNDNSVGLDSAIHDPNGWADLASDYVQLPQGGLYEIRAHLVFSAYTSGETIRSHVNHDGDFSLYSDTTKQFQSPDGSPTMDVQTYTNAPYATTRAFLNVNNNNGTGPVTIQGFGSSWLAVKQVGMP